MAARFRGLISNFRQSTLDTESDGAVLGVECGVTDRRSEILQITIRLRFAECKS